MRKSDLEQAWDVIRTGNCISISSCRGCFVYPTREDVGICDLGEMLRAALRVIETFSPENYLEAAILYEDRMDLLNQKLKPL
ncbi:MAG TPA: hypothetical protein P5136_00735 [Methanofastidiosum sp.]|nr:hypothetical protein [Methanofastidiosum sp.]